ncbi:hypothetical protein PGO14_05785 [Klebsiella aerogenes]
MILHDFSGRSIVSSQTELCTLLHNRPAFNSNNFILTFNDESGFPLLNILVKNHDCVIYFLGDKGNSYVSFCEGGGEDIIEFYEDESGELLEVLQMNVISDKKIMESALQFFQTKEKPDCIEWMDL